MHLPGKNLKIIKDFNNFSFKKGWFNVIFIIDTFNYLLYAPINFKRTYF
jgi:hypothetical protein